MTAWKSLCFSLCAIFFGRGQHESIDLRPSSTAAYANDHFLVKFKDNLNSCAHCLFEQKRDFRSASEHRSISLDNLLQRHQIQKITPVFRRETEQAAGRPSTSLENLKNSWRENTELVRTLYRTRANRATRAAQAPELFHVYRIDIPADRDLLSAVADFSADPHVAYAQLDYVLETQDIKKFQQVLNPQPLPPLEPTPHSPTLNPNDPFYHSSNSWGQGYEDLWGLKKIKARQAWTQGVEGEGVVVAVIDTGIDYNHPDIAENLWLNEGESMVADGIDDDGNGFLDDWRGWDFTTCSNFVGGTCQQAQLPNNDPKDGHGHGTHVSGTIAAIGNNGIGIIGVAPKAKIMPLKALNDQGAGLSNELAQAILYAGMNGADVLSNSWGSGFRTIRNPIVEEAIRTVSSFGAVVVFAAGNSDDDAAYYSPQNMPETITVASTDHLDQRSDFSNYGVEIDVAAPGGESGTSCGNIQVPSILSLRAGSTDMYSGAPCSPPLTGQMIVANEYYRTRGTSMACPHVSGLAALILSNRPELSAEELRQVIRNSSDDIDVTGFDILTGFGRINAQSALTSGSVLEAKIVSPSSASTQGTAEGSISILGTADGRHFDSYRIFYKAIDNLGDWIPIGETQYHPVENGELANWSANGLVTGHYWLKLVATDTDHHEFQDIVQFSIEKNVRQITHHSAWQKNPKLWGDWIVYEDARDHGNEDLGIYAFNLATQEEHAITHFHSQKPSIWGNKVIWQDKRNGNWDIYLYDLNNGQEQQITSHPANQTDAQIFENRVVFRDDRNLAPNSSFPRTDIYVFDLSSSTEQRITEDLTRSCASPRIWQNEIAWTSIVIGSGSYASRFTLPLGPEQTIGIENTGQFGKSLQSLFMNWALVRYGYYPEGSGDPYFSLMLHEINTGENSALPVETASVINSASVFGNRIVWQEGYDLLSDDTDIQAFDLTTQSKFPITVNPTADQVCSVWENRVVFMSDRNGNWDIFLFEFE